jgi:hypothetical protein
VVESLTGVGASRIVVTCMRRQVLLALVLVGLATLLGPVALAFAHCSTMAAPCMGPCALSAIVLEVPVPRPLLAPPAILEARSVPNLASAALPGLEPVPRPFHPST